MASPARPPENRAPAWLVIGSQVLGLAIFIGAVVLIVFSLIERSSPFGGPGAEFSQIGSAIIDPYPDYLTSTPEPAPLPTGSSPLPPETVMPDTPGPVETGVPPLDTPAPTATLEPAPKGEATVTDTPSPIVGSVGDIIKIAVDLPVSGGDAWDGIPTRNGMELAIKQANDKGGVTLDGKTYKLEMYALDDVPPGGQAHDPAQGSKNADDFIADPDVMVMLGPFNSNVAKAMMPKLNVAGLCNISPSNTNETLTKPEYGQTGTFRPTGQVTYFRVVTTDDLEGQAAADYALDKLGAKRVYVLDDTETYGKGIADGFEKRFMERGGAVLGHEGVQKGTTDYSSILAHIAALNPDLLYYGGTSSNNIPLARKQMKAAGLTIPLMGGDGIVDKNYITVAGADAEGSFGAVATVNVEVLPEARQFIEDYNQAGFLEPMGAYSGPGYEAANIAIAAIQRAGRKDRDAICQALRETRDFKGVLGTTSFDENGDTTNRIIGFYEVRNGKWEFVYQFPYTGK